MLKIISLVTFVGMLSIQTFANNELFVPRERLKTEVPAEKSMLIPYVFYGALAYPDVGHESHGGRVRAYGFSWLGGNWSLGDNYSAGFYGVWIDTSNSGAEYIESRPYFGFSLFSIEHRLELGLPTKNIGEDHYYEIYQLWSSSFAGGKFDFEPYLIYQPGAGYLGDLAWDTGEWLTSVGGKGLELGVASIARFSNRFSDSSLIVGPAAQFTLNDLFIASTLLGADTFESSKSVAVRVQVEGGF